SDTKEWAIRMKKNGYSYQTINNHKRSLKACFYTALNDDLVRKNPFNWNLSDVLEDDTIHKTALTDEQVNALLSFLKIDDVYKKYYNAIVVLLYTGLRISELCG
ncbi:MAG TPA: site-specific integrase, partial [Erysipelotrichaceae bacterium]|nr:site-specific integrase [Erysipelotrichaceae bacterium]